jgi:hypothetical protein
VVLVWWGCCGAVWCGCAPPPPPPPTHTHAHAQVDDRTYHEAMNVTKGNKNAANLWVHLYDYQTPYVMGCAG